jgi:hypothetical protein
VPVTVSEHYETSGGVVVPSPRRLHPADALTGVAYLGLQLVSAVTETASFVFCMALSHRDAIDERAAFLRDGMKEIEMLATGKVLVSGEEYGQAWRDGIEEGYVAFEVDEDDE